MYIQLSPKHTSGGVSSRHFRLRSFTNPFLLFFPQYLDIFFSFFALVSFMFSYDCSILIFLSLLLFLYPTLYFLCILSFHSLWTPFPFPFLSITIYFLLSLSSFCSLNILLLLSTFSLSLVYCFSRPYHPSTSLPPSSSFSQSIHKEKQID